MPSMFDILRPEEQRGLPGIALGQSQGGIGNVLGQSLLGASNAANQMLPAFLNPQNFESGGEAFGAGLLGTVLAGIGGPARGAQQREAQRQEEARKFQMDLLDKSFKDLTPEAKQQVMEQAGLQGLEFEQEPVEMGDIEKEFMTETFDAAAGIYTNKAASPEDRQLATGYLTKASKALGMNNEELFKALDLMSQLNLPFKGLGGAAKERAMSPREAMAAQHRAIIEGMEETGQAPDIEAAELMFFGKKKDETGFANYRNYFGQAAGGAPLNRVGLVSDLIKAGISADPTGFTVYLSDDPEKKIKNYFNVADTVIRLSGVSFDKKGNLEGAVSPRREEYSFPQCPGATGY